MNGNYRKDVQYDSRKRLKSPISPQQLIELGKLPPQAVDLEEAVLGALMLDKDALSASIDILKPEAFYKEAHQRIFYAICELFKKAQPVDILTVTQELKKLGELEIAGGAYYVTQLTNRVASAANVQVHARIVLEKYLQRELIRITTGTLHRSYEDTSDVFELLNQAEKDLFSISNLHIKKDFQDIRTLLGSTIREIEQAKDHEFSGVPSGYNQLDAITGGWQKSDLIILAARPSVGKCLGKGTKILMYGGELKKVEEIKKGELLMGVDSKPRKVISITNGIDNMYWVRQNRGIDYRVNESHILSLKRSRNNYGYRHGERQKYKGSHGDILNIPVKEYLSKSIKFKTNYKGYKIAVEFPEKKLIIEPYFLGLWLGDGNSKDVRITTADPEIKIYLLNYAKKLGLKLSEYEQPNNLSSMMAVTRGRKHSRQLFNLQDELRKLNVLNNKHIPEQYLINYRKNRLELLAGLIDSDGYLIKARGGYEITQKNYKLVLQIKFLSDSLGFRTHIAKRTGRIKSIDFYGEYYRVIIFGNIEIIPVKINRKKYKMLSRKDMWNVTGIKVEFDKVDEYYGFELEGDGLFLLEDMTVTHNTAFAVSMGRNAAVQFNRPTAIFSLEMSSNQLTSRIIAAECELPAEKLRRGNLQSHEFQQMNANIKKLSEAKIFIDDTPALSIFEFRAKARRLKSQHNIQMIIIDYLQLMVSGLEGKFSREQEVSLISRSLKTIAKELDIPIIALSQLSRAVEQRGGNKRPQLSDLRESGAIEQDADIVMFIYRPDLAGITQDENGMSTEGMAEIIIEKHRNGRLGSANLMFLGHLAKFIEPSSIPPSDSNEIIRGSKMNDEQEEFI